MRSALSRRLDQIEMMERQTRATRSDTRTWRQVLRDEPAAWRRCLRASVPMRSASANPVYRKARLAFEQSTTQE